MRRASKRAVRDWVFALASARHSGMERVEGRNLKPRSQMRFWRSRMNSEVLREIFWTETGRRKRRSRSERGFMSPRPNPPLATRAMGMAESGWRVRAREVMRWSSISQRARALFNPDCPSRCCWWRVWFWFFR